MDPNACWARLVSALEEGDGGEAKDAAVDLAEWIDKGGFVPHGLAVAMVAERNPAAELDLGELQKALRY